MNRRRMLHAFAAEVGEYEDAAVLPEETDPQLYLSRNRHPQPFHLICSKDNVLSQLSGEADVHLRDSSVNRFRMVVGDHVYIPAGTPHRIAPVTEGVTIRCSTTQRPAPGSPPVKRRGPAASAGRSPRRWTSPRSAGRLRLIPECCAWR